MEAYTQNLAKVHTSPYASPIRAVSLTGMPKMLVFIGGVETLRPSIVRFVEKAVAEGVNVESHLKEGMPHDYALIEEIAGRKTVREADQIIGQFVASVAGK